MGDHLNIGFLPLVDACLPILAQEHGFAEEEGLTLDFVRDVSWATVQDRLLYGHSDAAHLVAPLAIATTLGLGRPAQPLSAPFVLGLNGNAITFSTDLAARLVNPGELGDPVQTGARLRAEARTALARGQRLRLGVVHRYSSHNYKLRYWLAASGIRPDEDVEIVTVAPPFVADALATGEIDGACVGLVATARHFVEPENWAANAAILARAEYLDGSAELIERAISDRLLLARGGRIVHFPDFMFQYREAANFPWVSQAEWLYTQMVRWDGSGFDPGDAARAARVFRPDVYRSALLGSDEPLPGASSKVEGSLGGTTVVGTQQGIMTLERNDFFDGRVFDPSDLKGYLARLP